MTRIKDTFEGVEQAWKDFRRELADRLAQRDELDHVLFEVDVPERHDDACGPYVQVGWGEGEPLTAEISSNRVMAEKYRLTKPERRALRALGWHRPDKEHCNYWLTCDPSHADQVASMVVAALRDVFGVIHPAFVIDRFAEDVAATLAEQADETVPAPHDCLPEVVVPTNREHLVELVDTALGPDWGRAVPTRDEDGDLPFVHQSAVVFVRVLDDAPVVRIFSELVLEVSDREAAAFELNVLNRDHGAVKFVLLGTTVRMWTDVPALPLVPYHLRSALSMMCELAPRLDADLAHRVGGRQFLSESHGEAA